MPTAIVYSKFKSVWSIGIMMVLIMGIFLADHRVAFAATITVNSNADTAVDSDGDCTLRQALENATNGADLSGGDCVAGVNGSDTIVFSAPMTITLASAISGFTTSQVQPVIINGITGGHGNCVTKELGVILDGNGFTGLSIEGDDSTVKGLVLKNFGGTPLSVSGDNATVSCNIIGLNELGAAAGNTGGLLISGANATVGGSTQGDGNIISDNTGDGVTISGSGAVIKGNIIGLDIDGTVDMGNTGAGIEIFSGTTVTGVTIGGTGQYERNIISGNDAEGIFLDGSDISSVIIRNNYIGTDITGMVDLGSNSHGIDLGADVVITGLTIGGSNSGEGNIISGNNGGGIGITGATTDDLVITGNYIGLDAAGTGLLANSDGDPDTDEDVIEIEFASSGTIGGTTATSRNYIAGDGGIGLHILQLTGAPVIDIIGNYVGLDIDGNQIGGILEGISMNSDLSNVTVGGTAAGEGNVIAGMTAAGIKITGNGATVFGNKIGTTAAGAVSAGYGNDMGIQMLLDTATDNKIGGINTGEGNTIAGNTSAGIYIAGYSGADFPSNNSILGNSIFGNGFGIDFIADDADPVTGHTANDSGDGDSGPNGFLNHPVITGVNHGTETVTFSLDVPTGYYRVEFFKNPTDGLHGSGYGEGEDFVGASDGVHSTGSALTGQTYVVAGGIESTDVITATATKCTSSACTAFEATSEFSDSETPAIPVVAAASGGGGGGGTAFGCVDPLATNYQPRFFNHKQSLCVYPVKVATPIQIFRTLKVFMKGDDVKILQKYLNNYGYSVGATGPGSRGYETIYFGPRTKSAVMRFQKAQGLVADGVVGQKTRAKMMVQ